MGWRAGKSLPALGGPRSPPEGSSPSGTSGSGWEFAPWSFLPGREAFPFLGLRSHGIFRSSSPPAQDVTALISLCSRLAPPEAAIPPFPPPFLRVFFTLGPLFPPVSGLSLDLCFMGSAGARPCLRLGGLRPPGWKCGILGCARWEGECGGVFPRFGEL